MKTRTARQRAQASPQAAKSVRCAIYTRKSTEEGLDQEFNSLDAQREAAEAYIASQKHEGWTCLPDRYDDGGFSGGSMDRPALRRLLTDVEAGRVDAAVVYKVDRLSRSLLDFSRIIGTLDEHAVSFVSVTQQFNTTTSMGRLTLNILLSFAHYAEPAVMQTGSAAAYVPPTNHRPIGPHNHDIIRDAISASGALNFPRRSPGGRTASRASSFSEGSTRK